MDQLEKVTIEPVGWCRLVGFSIISFVFFCQQPASWWSFASIQEVGARDASLDRRSLLGLPGIAWWIQIRGFVDLHPQKTMAVMVFWGRESGHSSKAAAAVCIILERGLEGFFGLHMNSWTPRSSSSCESISLTVWHKISNRPFKTQSKSNQQENGMVTLLDPLSVAHSANISVTSRSSSPERPSSAAPRSGAPRSSVSPVRQGGQQW